MISMKQIVTPGFAFEIAGKDISTEQLVKFVSHCDLACDDCYMFQAQDQRSKPRFMPKAVVDQLAVRLAQYMREHQIRRMKVVLHGGEPMLAGMEQIRYFVRTMRAAVPDRTLAITIQTNGTRLTKR